MESILITRVGVEDLKKLQAISRVTFEQTFSEHNNDSDMETYLNSICGE